MTYDQPSHTLASPYRPNPAPPVAVSLALAVLVPLVVLVALNPGVVPSALALTAGYAMGRRTE